MKIVTILCCIFIFTSQSAQATVFKEAFNIAVTLYELYMKAKKEENQRREEQAQRMQQRPEGIIHVYSAWSGVIEPKYIKQPGLKSAKRKFMKIALIVQNRCDRPIFIKPHLFWVTKYYDREPFQWAGKVFRIQTPRWQYSEYDFGGDVLPDGWISPGQDVQGYVYSSIPHSESMFRWSMSYFFSESGDNILKGSGQCVIFFH